MYGHYGDLLSQVSKCMKGLTCFCFLKFLFMLLVYLGNIIEWCIPEETDLDGVEFKAMTSGSHTLDNDFV